MAKNPLATIEDGMVISEEQLEGEQTLDRALQLRNQAEELWWEFGATLYEIYEKKLYILRGAESWVSYIEQDLDISYSSAQKFVGTHKWLSGFDPDFQSWVHTLGSTKARLLTGRFQADDAKVWRNRVEGLSCRQIEAVVRGQDPQLTDGTEQKVITAGIDYGVDGYDSGRPDHIGESASPLDNGEVIDLPRDGSLVLGTPERPEVIHFSLYPAQRANVETAISQAKLIAQTDKDGHALDLISTAFLAGEGSLKDRNSYLNSVERVLGLRLVAFARDFSVVYGQETWDLVTDPT